MIRRIEVRYRASLNQDESRKSPDQLDPKTKLTLNSRINPAQVIPEARFYRHLTASLHFELLIMETLNHPLGRFKNRVIYQYLGSDSTDSR